MMLKFVYNFLGTLIKYEDIVLYFLMVLIHSTKHPLCVVGVL